MKKARTVSVADALVQVVDACGVRNVYGVSGANIEHFHDAVHRTDLPVRSIFARSETGAAFMADGEARAGGGIGVCCATSGGGMMNLAVGVAESLQDGIPVLAIVGQCPIMTEGRGGFQDSSGRGQTVHAAGLWGAISKSAVVLRQGDNFVTTTFGLLLEMMTGRPGPGALLVPRDVFEHRVSVEDLENLLDWIRGPWTRRDWGVGTSLSQSDLLRFMDTLARSKRPVLVAGPGVHAEDGKKRLIRFATRHQIPVCTTMADINAFPPSHPLFLGVIGAAGHPSAHEAVDRADVVIAMGCQLEAMQAGPVLPILREKSVLVVDPGSASTSRLGEIAQWLKTNPSRGLAELEKWMPSVVFEGVDENYQVERYFPEPLEADDDLNDALFQSDAIAHIETILPEKGSLLFDAGNCSAAALHYLNPPDEVRSIIALGMGGMGYAISASIGAQLACGNSEERTTVLCGDGAFLMEGMEVHTAVELGLPILFVVFNNGGHGMCTTRQRTFFEGREECARYGAVDIQQVVRGLGTEDSLWTGQAATPDELKSALKSLDQWNWNGPAVLELVLQAEEQPPFGPFVAKHSLRFRTPKVQEQQPMYPSAKTF